MIFSDVVLGHEAPIIEMFTATFTDSEGAEEGALIGGLVRDLISGTPQEDLHVFTAWEDSAVLGGLCFSRMTYALDDRSVFVLAPVAVSTAHHGQGIGQGVAQAWVDGSARSRCRYRTDLRGPKLLWARRVLRRSQPTTRKRPLRCSIQRGGWAKASGIVVPSPWLDHPIALPPCVPPFSGEGCPQRRSLHFQRLCVRCAKTCGAPEDQDLRNGARVQKSKGNAREPIESNP